LALYRNGCGLQFLTPAAEAFSMPLGQLRGVTASYMVAIVVKDSLELFDEDLIALEAVMNSIRNGLGMRETEIVK
jgi:hypothetical protein